MNHIAAALGMDFLPVPTARDGVFRSSYQKGSTCSCSSLAMRHRDSLLCLEYINKNKSLSTSLSTDDDTASTVSSLDESFTSTSSISVTFAQPLVTAIYVRPMTSPEEKRELFYCDTDYRCFRRDYLSKRTTTVQFSDDIVTNVWEYPTTEADLKEDLFYSERELKTFLDEFVASLHSGWP